MSNLYYAHGSADAGKRRWQDEEADAKAPDPPLRDASSISSGQFGGLGRSSHHRRSGRARQNFPGYPDPHISVALGQKHVGGREELKDGSAKLEPTRRLSDPYTHDTNVSRSSHRRSTDASYEPGRYARKDPPPPTDSFSSVKKAYDPPLPAANYPRKDAPVPRHGLSSVKKVYVPPKKITDKEQYQDRPYKGSSHERKSLPGDQIMTATSSQVRHVPRAEPVIPEIGPLVDGDNYSAPMYSDGGSLKASSNEQPEERRLGGGRANSFRMSLTKRNSSRRIRKKDPQADSFIPDLGPSPADLNPSASGSVSERSRDSDSYHRNQQEHHGGGRGRKKDVQPDTFLIPDLGPSPGDDIYPSAQASLSGLSRDSDGHLQNHEEQYAGGRRHKKNPPADSWFIPDLGPSPGDDVFYPSAPASVSGLSHDSNGHDPNREEHHLGGRSSHSRRNPSERSMRAHSRTSNHARKSLDITALLPTLKDNSPPVSGHDQSNYSQQQTTHTDDYGSHYSDDPSYNNSRRLSATSRKSNGHAAKRREHHLGRHNSGRSHGSLNQNPKTPAMMGVNDGESYATSRCPPLDLGWLLQLSDKRKSDAAVRRGSRVAWKRGVIEENQLVETLMKEGFTAGLARTLIQNTDRFSVRIWLVNNSGSMNQNDGHLMIQNPKDPYKYSNVNCTRWEELQACVQWHAEWSGRLQASMAVRLLNDPGRTIGPQQLGIAASANREIDEELTRLKHVFTKSKPSGTTELTSHLQDIVDSVMVMADRLRERKEMVAIVIVTDSLPSSVEGKAGKEATKEFLNTLRLLRGLPVWVVVRLSTDEKRVVDFYNDLDDRVDNVMLDDNSSGVALVTSGESIHLDVLDDFVSEAEEVYRHNPWLNYALPLHLCRESGVSFPAFDSLDNRALSPGELVDFCQLLFDHRITFNPITEYRDFRMELDELVTKERKLFHPIKKKFMPWIDMKEIDKRYQSPGKSASCNCVIQ